MTSGDIFFTPPAYVCDIQKTFSAEHEAAYKAKENIPFRKTLDGLVVKSQLSCDQADALCTVNKFFEKVNVEILLGYKKTKPLLASFRGMSQNDSWKTQP